MTAKEKAEELMSKFVGISLSQVNELVDGIRIRLAKESALIMADETWKVLWKLYDNPNISDSAELIIKEQIDFWADVKAELSQDYA